MLLQGRSVILFLLALVLMAGATRLRLSTDVLKLLPSDTPGVAALQRLNAQLADEHQLLILIEAAEGEALDDEARLEQLGDQMRATAGTLSVKSETELGLENDPAFAKLMAYLWLNGDPANLNALLAQSSGTALTQNIAKAKASLTTSMDQIEMVRASYDPLGLTRGAFMDWVSGSVASMMTSADEARLFFVQAKPELSGYKDYAQWIAALRTAIEPIAKEGGWRLSITGSPAFGAEIGQGMEQDMAGTSGICAALVVLMFLWFQRSLRQLLAITLCLTLTLALTLGLYGWCFGDLGVMSAGFAAILMGLTVDYAMIISREVPLVNGDALKASRHCRPGILWGAVTTAAPFSVMLFSAMPGGGQLGFLVSAGLFFGAVIMLGLYPRLAFPRQASAVRQLEFDLPAVPRRWALRAALSLLLLCGGFLWCYGDRLSVAFELAHLRPRNSNAVEGLERIQQRFPAWGESLIHVLVDDEAATHEQQRNTQAQVAALQARGLVSAAWLPFGVLPDDTAFANNLQRVKTVELLPALKAALDAAGFNDKASALTEAVTRQWQAWQSTSAAAAFAEIREQPMIQPYLLKADATHKAAVIGGLRLKAPLDQDSHAALRALDLPGLTVAAWPLLRFDLNAVFALDVKRIFIPMGIVLAITLCVALRQWRDALIALGTLGLSLMIVYGIVTLTSGRWHFLNLMGLPLLLGASLDYMLHIIFALRREGGDVRRVLRSTGMAVLFCSLSTAVGFCSLLLASNDALVDLGIVTGLGILVSAGLALLLLPGLWLRCSAKEGAPLRTPPDGDALDQQA
ncbi:MAG: MMPL family transporter [Verrucomicrobiaceae bacterium]|jgi:predicted exporter